MGLAKRAWEEAESRDWSASNSYVCADCVEDDYLKELIFANRVATYCDYCHTESETPIAAPLETLMEPIAAAMFAHFREPGAAGVPRDDGDWVIEPIHTSDALSELGLEGQPHLLEDVVDAFSDDCWVPAAHGHWASSHESECLYDSWRDFTSRVKYKTRYFFLRDSGSSSAFQDSYAPSKLLERIGQLVDELKLFSVLDSGQSLFRVRCCTPDDEEISSSSMGPPPSEKAAAGRMNPAGISYFYLAWDSGTAIAEVISKPPCRVRLAKFTVKKPLRLLNLVDLPLVPSVFDEPAAKVRQRLMFLKRFVTAIAQPVPKDGSEHVEYVPSQVVCEYFREIFRASDGEPVAGIRYRSAIQRDGVNVVLFPPGGDHCHFDDLVQFSGGALVALRTWQDLIRELK